MQRALEDLLEGLLSGWLTGLRHRAPDEDTSVVGGRSENGAEFGVRPGYGPDGAVVPAEGFGQLVCRVVYVEDLDGFVGGAGG